MKETGMLFNAEMVRALLDGRKTQTRRQFSKKMLETFKFAAQAGEVSYFIEAGKLEKNDLSYILDFCPYGKVGDRIWVRETWSPDFAHHYPHDRCWYAADDNRKWDIELRNGTRGIWSPESNTFVPFKWRPSIHMPRWASRITLEISDVRVERLHDISEEDARAEGCYWSDGKPESGVPTELMLEAKADFQHLWNSTGGDWDANPWVWVIEFKQIETGAAA